MKISQTINKSQYNFIKERLRELTEPEQEELKMLLSANKGILITDNTEVWPDFIFLYSIFKKIQTQKKKTETPELNLFICDNTGFATDIIKKMKSKVKISELKTGEALSETVEGTVLMTAAELVQRLKSDFEIKDRRINLLFIQKRQSIDIDWDREIWFIHHKLTSSSQKVYLSAEKVTNKRILSLFGRTMPLEINSIKNKNSLYNTFFDELEGTTVGVDKSEMQQKSEALGEAIDLVIKNIRENEDPAQMNMYRKLFKKHVPFTMRHYFAAWMMKEYLDKNGKKKKWGKTLFISVGKNRKVYPKDLISLFTGSGAVKKEEIGDIKIMDSYSFLNINPKSADKAIEKLDGSEFRGRKLTVNYARKNS